MTKDLGVWTAEDCALVLIDRSSMSAFEDQPFRRAVEAEKLAASAQGGH
jgi:hypothetical protein